MKVIYVVLAALVAVTSVASWPVVAGTLERARQMTQTTNQAAQRSQQGIDKLDDETQKALQEYRAALWQRQQLEAYIQQVKPLLAQQQAQLAALKKQLVHQGDIKQQIMPLMLQMMASLDKFVSLDLPFLQQERATRLANLKRDMADSSIPFAAKFQRLAQAYRIEAGYGLKLGAAQRDIVVGGQHENVNVLRVGRIVLLYETPDGDDTGYWDPNRKQWVSLDDEYARDIHEGLKIARGDVAGKPLPLPLPTPAFEGTK